MEGKRDSSEVLDKVHKRVPEAFVAGCAFWPAANFINFSYLSAGARVPYLAAVGGLWNAYLSYINAKDA